MGKIGETELYWEDAVVIVLYFLMVIGVGIWASIQSKRDSVRGYFLANRSMHWIPVGASLFASNIGSSHFVGLAGSGAKSGVGIAGFELNAIFILLILGWFFVPVYMASGVYTMPEYLRKRFGGQRIRIYLSVLALLLYVFTKISADLYAGAIFIHQSIKLDMYGSIVVLLAIASIFTIAGGLTAVMWTDFVQTILMLVGAFALMILSFIQVGGYENLVEQFKSKTPNESFVGYDAKNKSCSVVPDNYMSLLRPPNDPDLPWTGMMFGLTIASVWYWCSDQVIVQRVLSAKDLSHAKGGCILAGYLKLLPLFLLVLPGMASKVLFPDEIGCSNPKACKEICGSELGCTNIAYPKLVLELMPAGARGLMISVMLAALMSSLTSIFNSSSTIFTMDIWTRIRKQATEMELLIVSRVFVLLLVVVSVLWIPVVQNAQNSQLFHYIQSVTSYLAPPVCAVYVLAILSARINEKGAFWGLMVGLVVGLIRFGWELSYAVPPCSAKQPDPRPAIISKVHYLHFGIILFFISCSVTIVVSLFTQPIDMKHLYRLTLWTRRSKEVRTDITSKSQPSAKVDLPMGEINVAYQNVEEINTISAVNMVVENKNSENSKASLKTAANLNGRELITEEPKYLKSFKQNADIEEPNIIFSTDHPLWKRFFYFICGITEDLKKSQNEPEKPSPEVEADTAADLIVERPVWRRLCNANAIILLVVASFIWGFYA